MTYLIACTKSLLTAFYFSYLQISKMPLTANNVTRIKWHVENFHKFLSDINKSPKKESDLFTLANHLDTKFTLFFAQNNTGYHLGIVMKEFHGNQELDLEVKFWIKDDTNAETRSWKYRKCAFKKTGYTCKVSLNLLHICNENTNRLSKNSTFFCELRFANLSDHILVPKSYLLLRQKLFDHHKNGEETQVTIKADDNEFKVGRDVLICQSEVFASMLLSAHFKESQSGEILIEDFEPATIESFIRWLYLGEIDNEDLVDDLFALADKYLINELKSQCSIVMSSTLDDKNAISRLVCSVKYEKEALMDQILDFLADKEQAECMKLFMSSVWMEFSLKDEKRASETMEKFYKRLVRRLCAALEVQFVVLSFDLCCVASKIHEMPDLSIENVTRVKWEIYGYRKHFIPNSFFSLPVGGQFCLDGHPDIKLCLKFYHRDSKAQFIFVLDEIGTHKQITLSFDSWIENSYNNSVSVQSATSHFTGTGKTFTLEFEALKPGSQFSYNPKLYDHESTFWHILNYRKNSSVMSSNSLVNTYNGLVAAKNTTFDLEYC
ncbi:Speckle-type POZ protein-like protein [Aphelenchoides bicaudatus]|nr:Speckle-type POZ protein-like protein [Aphelenchoides bicaudatus]